MLNLYRNIKKRRTELNMTQEELAQKMGYSGKSMIAKIEAGKVDLPQSKIMAFAAALNTTPSYLMGWDENVSNEKLELGKYRIPIVSVVAAGIPIYSEDNIIGWVDYDKDPGTDVFALKINGDSMAPKISSGDIVIVDKSAAWEDNDIVIVRVNGHEGTCKRVKKYADGISLISINPNYEPMYYTKDQVNSMPVEIVGRVMEARSKL